MGVLRDKPLPIDQQFIAVSDHKLRMTLVALANRYSREISEMIYHTYQDDRLASLYRQIRASGIYQHGGKTKVRRKIVEFPSPYVYDFVDTVLSQMYGPDWLKNDKALNHELVKPWWVVARL